MISTTCEIGKTHIIHILQIWIEKSLQFKRTDDLLNDTELSKGAAAPPDAHMTGSEQAATQTESSPTTAVLRSTEGLPGGELGALPCGGGRALRPESMPAMIVRKTLAVFSSHYIVPLINTMNLYNSEID